MKEPAHPSFVFLFILFLCLCLFTCPCFPASYDGPWYDSSAYTECKEYAEAPLYEGGIMGNVDQQIQQRFDNHAERVYSPAYVLQNLTPNNKYAFSCWVKINGADSALIRARFSTNNSTFKCVGTVLAKSSCWSFLKGGFVPDSSSTFGVLFFQSFDESSIEISVTSSSLQPFTPQQWKMHQDDGIRRERKRMVIVHVSDAGGQRVPGAIVTVQQISKDFPFGSAIAKTIIGNSPYQNWFVKRFNAAVFENELKWYANEPDPGKVNYGLADQMLSFTRANKIITRGHNIFWEDPVYTPAWVRNLTSDDLKNAVNSRIQSLMYKYKEEFIHWDVSNEMLHFDFYEQRLGPNASLDFFHTAQASDPRATLFMNDFNVIETCDDVNSTVDTYVSRLKEFKKGGAILEGIGLEGHFTMPNLPLMRAVLDKLATLNLPIWLTEIDISKKLDQQTQFSAVAHLMNCPDYISSSHASHYGCATSNAVWLATNYTSKLADVKLCGTHHDAIYLEDVLREGFSHPSVNGIMLWTALHPNGCYQMCLTDNNLRNLPAGNVVDQLLQEWETGVVTGQTDDHGAYIFNGFLGEYMVSVQYENKTANSTFSLCRGDETKHLTIQL